ncbi:MAG: hypothetical protein K2X91_13320 [Thermoleophilia bacterium]|nr:hypothetical protein [Thermoleophilia bacterium]
MRVEVCPKEFARLSAMLGRPSAPVSDELRREVAEARQRHPQWFAPPVDIAHEMRLPAWLRCIYLSPAEREFLEGSHAGRH